MDFELFVNDFERAMAFCKALFGWVFKPAYSDIVEIFASGVSNGEPLGAFRKRTGILLGSARLQTHINGAVIQWQVESVGRSIAQAAKNGGLPRPPLQLSNGDWCAHIVDTEGNHFSVRQTAIKH